MALGKDSLGLEALAPVRPTLFDQSRDMAIARREDATAGLGSVVIAPERWELIARGDGSVLCQIPGAAACRFRRAYGYIGAVCDEPKIVPE